MPTLPLPKDFPSHFPKSKKEEQEFGKGKEDIMVCKRCNAVYFYKSWHHRINRVVGQVAKSSRGARGPDRGWRQELKKTKRLKYTICPACQQILDKKYEGEIILENVPEKFKEDIKKLAENFGKRAFEKDPMDRIISIKEKKVSQLTNIRRRRATSRKEFRGESDIEILTTENQLAQKLARKINETFKGKLEISFSHSKKESTLRAKIIF